MKTSTFQELVKELVGEFNEHTHLDHAAAEFLVNGFGDTLFGEEVTESEDWYLKEFESMWHDNPTVEVSYGDGGVTAIIEGESYFFEFDEQW